MHPRRVLYSVEEAADLVGVSPSTMYRWARAGDLRTIPLNGRLAVPVSSLECLFRSSTGDETNIPAPEDDVNEVAIAGCIVADPAPRQSRAGLRYTALRLAVNRRGSTKAPFHVVVIAFGARADAAADLHAGDRVRVDGRLGQREWTAEDGARVGAQRIIAERIRVIETTTTQEVAS